MDTRVDQELLLEFFLVFSRFEYALKASDLFKRRPGVQRAKAEPDWDRFADSLEDRFSPSNTNALRLACDYLRDMPPNQQVIFDNSVAWETPLRPGDETDIQYLLRMVRRVRNNLFHGGKYNIGEHEDTERTETLLRGCLTILSACLLLSPRQGAAYREARL